MERQGRQCAKPRPSRLGRRRADVPVRPYGNRRRWGTTHRRVDRHTNLLLGLDSGVFEADGRKHAYNSALLLDVDAAALPALGASTAAMLASPSAPGPLLAGSAMFPGRTDADVLGRYDKIHCVPFGEYVPFRDWLPWMRAFAPYDFDYSIEPGRGETHFPSR